MTPHERARRNGEFFSARARGLTWPTVAAQFGLSERQCRRIVHEQRECRPAVTELDLYELVQDTIEAYDAGIEELALLARETEHHGAKLGAIKARLDAIRSKWEVLRAIGVLPADLGRLSAEIDVQQVAPTIVEVFDRRGVPPEVQREIVDVIERRHEGQEPPQG